MSLSNEILDEIYRLSDLPQKLLFFFRRVLSSSKTFSSDEFRSDSESGTYVASIRNLMSDQAKLSQFRRDSEYRMILST